MSSRLDELLDKYDENPLDPDIIYSIVKELSLIHISEPTRPY